MTLLTMLEPTLPCTLGDRPLTNRNWRSGWTQSTVGPTKLDCECAVCCHSLAQCHGHYQCVMCADTDVIGMCNHHKCRMQMLSVIRSHECAVCFLFFRSGKRLIYYGEFATTTEQTAVRRLCAPVLIRCGGGIKLVACTDNSLSCLYWLVCVGNWTGFVVPSTRQANSRKGVCVDHG